jgi:hypothetical protein
MKSIIFILLIVTQVNALWVQTNLGDGQIACNLYTNGTEIYAATLNGVYKTSDTGNPWFNIGLTSRLVFDVITSGQFILAATEGTGPGVFRTSDNGITWLEASGIENQSVRAFAKNSSYIFAAAWGGGVFRSSDDGASWTNVGLTNEGFRSIYAAGEKIFAGGSKIFSTTDNGTNWQERTLPWPSGDTWGFYYNNNVLYACDMGLYTSTDYGNTWQLKYGITFDSAGTPTDIKIFKDMVSYQNKLIASIAFNGLAISDDLGETWIPFNEGFDFSDWTFVGLAIKDPYIWAIRDFMANAYLRPLSEITAIDENVENSNKEYLLSQNYPNPFNPSTKIKYTIPSVIASETKQSQLVSLKVYDVLGNEIATLVNEEQTAGAYEVEFTASQLSSGIYFYKLQAGSFIETKKMILLR